MSLATSLPQSDQQRRRETVMICDDDPDALTIYKYTLGKSYNVIATSSGKECLAKYSEELRRGARIDALLLDYRLGDMNGDEVAYKIRMVNDGSTKVILITAYELEKSLLAKLKDSKCIVIDIKKPISPMALLVKVAQVLDLEKSRVEALDNPSTSEEEEEAASVVIAEAIMTSMDRRLGTDTSRLVLKTLKLVYRINEDEIRERPKLFEEKLGKILGDRTVKIIMNDAYKAVRK